MMSFIRMVAGAAAIAARRFRSEVDGNVAIMFGFASVAIAVGVGAGIDLSGAYAARQRLSQVATLTCQYSVRQSVINTQSSNAAVAADPGNTFQYYLSTVNTFATNTMTAQHVNAAQVTDSSGGTSAYFTATSGVNGPTGGVTDLTMSYPTAFLKIIKVTSVPVHARINCQQASTTTQTSTGSNVLSEGFETNCTTYCFTQPSGVGGALLNPTTTFGSSPTYIGDAGFAWYVIGYCLEIDYVGVINSSDPQGTHSAELDCDNSNHTAGNSSMSTKVFLNAGNYELRYFYRSRIQQSALDPYYVCGWSYNDPTKTDDLSWVNSTNFPSLGTTSQMRTNQMNVYLDQSTATAMPPLHYTAYSNTPTQQLAGSNLVDSCVYSYKWVERSVTVNVSASGYFWLSFAADGQNDSFGAQLDNIRLCPNTCSGTPQDNFPDTTPQTQPSMSSTQASSATAYFTNSNWGSWNTYQSQYTPLCLNSSFSRCSNLATTSDSQVLLDPGFYELTYQYYPLSTFSGAPSSGCTSAPTASSVSSMRSAAVTARSRYSGTTYSTYADVDMLGLYLTFPGQTLTPNPGGSTTTSNPLVDLCYYATASMQRKVAFQITKPGLYDLAFYAQGTSTSKYLGASFGTFNSSGAPTNFTLLYLGSPYTLATSSNCSGVPVPTPQVGSAITGASGTGYTISSTDPFQFGASSSACTP